MTPNIHLESGLVAEIDRGARAVSWLKSMSVSHLSPIPPPRCYFRGKTAFRPAQVIDSKWPTWHSAVSLIVTLVQLRLSHI
jgi:hypothetical protein